jgi:hypothetical protein
MVGSLMHLTTTRPDIIFAITLISRFMVDLHENHMKEANRISNYIKGIREFGVSCFFIFILG